MSAKRIAELSVAWLFHALVVLAAVAVAETVPGIPPTQRPDVAAAQPGVQIILDPDRECEASCRYDAALPDPWDPVDEAAPPLYEWDSPEKRESYVKWYQSLSPQERERARFADPHLKEELDRILAELEEKEAPLPEETEPAELTEPEVSEPVEPEFTWDDYVEWFEDLDPDDQERERARLTAEHEAALDQAMAQREAAEAPASAEDVREEEQAAHPEAAEAPAPEADPVDEAASPLYEWDSEEKEAPLPEETEPAELTEPAVSEPVEPKFTWDDYAEWFEDLDPDDQERERARLTAEHEAALDQAMAQREAAEAPASAEDVREEEPDPLDDPWRDWVKWWEAASPEERERAAQEQGLDAEQQEMLNQRVAEQAAHPEAAEAPAPEADPVDEAAPPLYERYSPEERESYVKWYQSLSPQERERARFADPHLKEELDRILAEQEEKEAPLPEETEPAELTEPEVSEPVEPEPPAAETVPGISPMPAPDADAAQPDGEPGPDVAPAPADGDPTPGATPDGPPAAPPGAHPVQPAGEPEPPPAETVPGISPMPGPDADAAQPDGEPGADVAPAPADGDPTPGAAHEPAASTAPDGPPAASPAAPPGKVQWTIRAEPGVSLKVNDWQMVEPYIVKRKGVPWVYWQVAGLTDGGPTIQGWPLEPDEQPEPRWVSVSQTEPDRVIWRHQPAGYSVEDTEELIEWYRAGGSGTYHYDSKQDPQTSEKSADGKGNFVGTYQGDVGGEASGTIRFEVREHNRVSGSVSGSYGRSAFRGTFSGTVEAQGRLQTHLTGTITTQFGDQTTEYEYQGSISGAVDGRSGVGDWRAGNQYGSPTGTWSANRR